MTGTDLCVNKPHSVPLVFKPLCIITVMKSRKMSLAGHVARMGRRGMLVGFWWESQKERDHYKDLDIGRRIILKWILERCNEVV
jgi:hypothetical protein